MTDFDDDDFPPEADDEEFEPIVPEKFAGEDIHIDVITTSKYSFVLTWIPSGPDIKPANVLAKISQLIKADSYVQLKRYAPYLGIKFIHQARHEIYSQEVPSPQEPASFLAAFQVNLDRHDDTLEARDLWVNFKKSRPNDFDPVSLKPTSQEGKQIEANVERFLTSYRAGNKD